MSIPEPCNSSTSSETVPNKIVLEKIQQFLKEKNCYEFAESTRLESFGGHVDQNQNTIVSEEESAEINDLKRVLDYKKNLLLREPEIIEVIRSFQRIEK